VFCLPSQQIFVQKSQKQNIRNMETEQDAFDRIPKPLIAIIGSTYCFIVLCVLLVIPILEIAIGGAFRNQCPINSNIPVYLIVTGVCGLASILLALAVVRDDLSKKSIQIIAR